MGLYYNDETMTTRVRNLIFRDPSSTAEKTQRTLFRVREEDDGGVIKNNTPSPKIKDKKKATRSEIRARVERERKERLVKRMKSYGIVSPSVSTTKMKARENDDDDDVDERYADLRARLVDVCSRYQEHHTHTHKKKKKYD